MARIFITGSSDGLGLLAGKELIAQGHTVVLHARNAAKRDQTFKNAPGAEEVLVADLSGIEEIKSLASAANDLGRFDAVIHNAGVYQSSRQNDKHNGLPVLFTVNSLAPYILTCLMPPPGRLIYMSSGMHLQGQPKLDLLAAGKYESINYSDTKLQDVILAMAVARKWPGVFSNAVNPGWVPTKMGGAGAPDSLEEGYATQVWLAASNDNAARQSGNYFHHKKKERFLSAAADPEIQEKFLGLCGAITGVHFDSIKNK